MHDRTALEVLPDWIEVSIRQKEGDEVRDIGEQVFTDLIGDWRQRDRRSEALVLTHLTVSLMEEWFRAAH